MRGVSGSKGAGPLGGHHTERTQQAEGREHESEAHVASHKSILLIKVSKF
jgi:hypothetical protein